MSRFDYAEPEYERRRPEQPPQPEASGDSSLEWASSVGNQAVQRLATRGAEAGLGPEALPEAAGQLARQEAEEGEAPYITGLPGESSYGSELDELRALSGEQPGSAGVSPDEEGEAPYITDLPGQGSYSSELDDLRALDQSGGWTS